MQVYNQQELRRLRRTVGQNIRRSRERRHMTLLRLARKSGVQFGIIDRYELGIGDIKLEHTLRIACTLQIEVAALFEAQKVQPS